MRYISSCLKLRMPSCHRSCDENIAFKEKFTLGIGSEFMANQHLLCGAGNSFLPKKLLAEAFRITLASIKMGIRLTGKLHLAIIPYYLGSMVSSSPQRNWEIHNPELTY